MRKTYLSKEEDTNHSKAFFMLFVIGLLVIGMFGLCINKGSAEIIPSERRINWSPGIPGGIPYYPVSINVKNAPYNAAGDGMTDDTTAIQNAINDCAIGKAVYLPEGTYRLTSSLSITKGIVLRGDGPGKTFLIKDTSGGVIGIYGTSSSTNTDVLSGYIKGSNVITVSNALSFRVGDYIVINQENDADIVLSGIYQWSSSGSGTNEYYCESNGGGNPNFIKPERVEEDESDMTLGTLGSLDAGKWGWGDNDSLGYNTVYVRLADNADPDGKSDGYLIMGIAEKMPGYCKRAIAQIVEITGISGFDISINRPLYFTYCSAYDPEITSINLTTGAGIEDLYIEKTVGVSGSIIVMDMTANCWVKNVETYNTYSKHIAIIKGYANEVRGSYMHHSHDYSSDKGYGVWVFQWSTDNLIEDCILYHLRHGLVLEYGGCGNVFGYNYAYTFYGHDYPNTNWLMQSIHTHGGHPFMNLFEGNYCDHIVHDSYLGSSRDNTALRNYSVGSGQAGITINLNAIQVDKYNLYENFIGNVFKKPGDTGVTYSTGSGEGVWKLGCYKDNCSNQDKKVQDTMIMHGNFDYITNAIQWDSSISDHNLPNSYYFSSKPAFFGELPWPIIGPDLSQMVSDIPAKLRFDGKKLLSLNKPAPPKKLQIID